MLGKGGIWPEIPLPVADKPRTAQLTPDPPPPPPFMSQTGNLSKPLTPSPLPRKHPLDLGTPSPALPLFPKSFSKPYSSLKGDNSRDQCASLKQGVQLGHAPIPAT